MGVQSSSYQSTVASDECPRYLRKRHMTISFAGDAGSGRSTLCYLTAKGTLPKPKLLTKEPKSPFYMKRVTLSNHRTLELVLPDSGFAPRTTEPTTRWCEYIFVMYDLSRSPEKVEETLTRWVEHARSSPNVTTKIAILGTKSDIADSMTREEVSRVALSLQLPCHFASSQTPTAWLQLLHDCVDEFALAIRIGIPPDYYIGGPGFDLDEEDDKVISPPGRPRVVLQPVHTAQ